PLRLEDRVLHPDLEVHCFRHPPLEGPGVVERLEAGLVRRDLDEHGPFDEVGTPFGRRMRIVQALYAADDIAERPGDLELEIYRRWKPVVNSPHHYSISDAERKKNVLRNANETKFVASASRTAVRVTPAGPRSRRRP